MCCCVQVWAGSAGYTRQVPRAVPRHRGHHGGTSGSPADRQALPMGKLQHGEAGASHPLLQQGGAPQCLLWIWWAGHPTSATVASNFEPELSSHSCPVSCKFLNPGTLHCWWNKGLSWSKNKHKPGVVSMATDDSCTWKESKLTGFSVNRDQGLRFSKSGSGPTL